MGFDDLKNEPSSRSRIGRVTTALENSDAGIDASQWL